jgi:streptogramin lyase
MVPVTIADAHGTPLTSNTIAGSPSLSATSSNSAAVAVSVSQNPYAVTITPAATGTGTATLTLTESAATVGDGITATTQISAAFSLNPTPQALDNPLGVALDHQGNLWVANYGSGQVTEYAPPYTGNPIFALDGMAEPAGVDFDSTGDLLVSELGGNEIRVYAPPYANTPTATFSTGVSPFQMALDANGSLYVALASGTGIQVFNPPFTSSSTSAFTIINGIFAGYGLAFDGSGNLWFHDFGNGLIEYSPPFSASSNPGVIMTSGSFQDAGELAFDSSGNLYMANQAHQTILEVPPPFTTGSIASQSLTVSGNPYGVAVGPNDVFGSSLAGHVYEYAFPLTGTSTPVATLAGKRSSNPQALIKRLGVAR